MSDFGKKVFILSVIILGVLVMTIILVNSCRQRPASPVTTDTQNKQTGLQIKLIEISQQNNETKQFIRLLEKFNQQYISRSQTEKETLEVLRSLNSCMNKMQDRIIKNDYALMKNSEQLQQTQAVIIRLQNKGAAHATEK